MYVFERKGGGTHKHRFVVPLTYAFIGCCLYVPWLEIERATLVYQDDAPANWATWPGPYLFIWKYNSGTARWRSYIGQGMWERARRFHALWVCCTTFSQFSQVYQPGSSQTSIFLVSWLGLLYTVQIIQTLVMSLYIKRVWYSDFLGMTPGMTGTWTYCMASLRDFRFFTYKPLSCSQQHYWWPLWPTCIGASPLGFEFLKTFLFLALENYASSGADLVTCLSNYTLFYFSYFCVWVGGQVVFPHLLSRPSWVEVPQFTETKST